MTISDELEEARRVILEEKTTGLNGRGGRKSQARPILIPLSDIEPEEVTWLWLPYIPLGKLTLLEGDPGLGKTWLALALAAAVTRGAGLPGADGRPDEGRKPGNILFLGGEDGAADTIRPRFDRMGGDPRNFIIFEGWKGEGEEIQPIFLGNLPMIEEAMEKIRPALMIIDPIQAFLGAKVDAYRANEVRPILKALAGLGEKFRTSILILRHLAKSRSDRAIYQGLGSIDFAAVARSILLIGEDPGDSQKRIMAHLKSSLAPLGSSLIFNMREGEFFWGGTSPLT